MPPQVRATAELHDLGSVKNPDPEEAVALNRIGADLERAFLSDGVHCDAEEAPLLSVEQPFLGDSCSGDSPTAAARASEGLSSWTEHSPAPLSKLRRKTSDSK